MPVRWARHGGGQRGSPALAATTVHYPPYNMLQFVNAHSHLCMTAVSTGAIEQVTCGTANTQWRVEEPTNSAN